MKTSLDCVYTHTLASDWESFLSHKEVIIAAIRERRKEIRGSSCWTLSLSIQLTLYNISLYLCYLSWSSRWLECRRHDDPSCARKSFVYFLIPCTATEGPFPLVVHECRQLLLYFCCPSWLRLMFEAWRWGKSGSFPHPSLVCILFVFTLFLPETKKILKSCIISSQDKRLVVTMPCLIASRLPDICYRHDFFHDCLLSEL